MVLRVIDLPTVNAGTMSILPGLTVDFDATTSVMLWRCRNHILVDEDFSLFNSSSVISTSNLSNPYQIVNNLVVMQQIFQKSIQLMQPVRYGL